jgi:hypothetical protein
VRAIVISYWLPSIFAPVTVTGPIVSIVPSNVTAATGVVQKSDWRRRSASSIRT